MDLGTIARVRDLWLEGTYDHTPAGLDFADHVLIVAPHIPHLVRAQRALLRRMVRYLLGQGVKQFLDLGSGIPTCGHVHEIARSIDPEYRVVYVDSDPGIAEDGRALLAGNDRATYLCADIRRTTDVLEARETRQLIDFDQPVAVLLIETLLHIPDTDDPNGMVAGYVDVLSSGSFLGISHFNNTEAIEAGFNMFARMFGSIPRVFLRDRARQAEFFTGLEMIHPGIVPLQLWQPGPNDIIDRNPELTDVYAGLGRKA